MHCHIGARRRVVSAIRWREKHRMCRVTSAWLRAVGGKCKASRHIRGSTTQACVCQGLPKIEACRCGYRQNKWRCLTDLNCHIYTRRRVVSAIRWREKHIQRVVTRRKDTAHRWSVGKIPRNICRGIQLGRSKCCSIGNRYRSIPIKRWLGFWHEHCGCVGVIEGCRALESGIRSEEYPK